MKDLISVVEVFFLYIKISIFYLFKIKKNERIFLAGKCLFENMSYRLPQSASRDKFIGLKVFKDFCYQFFHNRNYFPDSERTSNATIFDGGNDYKEQKQKYVSRYINRKPFFISRSDIIFYDSTFRSFFLFFLTSLFSPVIIILSLFAKKKSNLALLIKEFPETVNLLYLLKKLNLDEVYFYCPYEVDANLITLILMKNKIKVIKIPSHGPLKTHNSILFSDELVLSSQYQFDELNVLKETIKISKTRKWFPQTSWLFIDKYLKKKFTTPQNVIGFYSHGSWVRKKSNHSDDGLGIGMAEEILLKEIAGLLNGNKEIHLIVFPHPKEKKDHSREQLMAYYDKYLTGCNYSLAGAETITALSFEMVDVGVSAFSAIIFERLLCGFKTLIGAYGIPGFPLPGSSLNNITVKKTGILAEKLTESLNRDADDFFRENKLTGYRYFEYEELIFPETASNTKTVSYFCR